MFVDAGFAELDPLGQIDGVVADALQIFGHHQVVDGAVDFGVLLGEIFGQGSFDLAEVVVDFFTGGIT